MSSKSKLETFFMKFLPSCKKDGKRVFYPSIAMKITAAYALVLFVLLMVTSTILAFGVYTSFYHQAETSIKISEEHFLKWLQRPHDLSELEAADDLTVPGVVMRIVDTDGNVIYESDHHFPSLKKMVDKEWDKMPFWANQSMRVFDFGRLTFYHDVIPFTLDGRDYEAHMFCMITGEADFLERLRWALLVLMAAFFLLAIVCGFIMSKRLLRPLREMTKTVQKIEVENLGARLEVPPVHDEIAELARRFNHMLDRLETGFEQQRQFVSDASHELRTPVTVILGYSDLLSRWGREDEGVLEEGISSIRTEAENMQQLIERLLFLARTDQNRQTFHKEEVHLGEVLEDVVRRMKVVEKTHSVELTENDPGTIVGDPVLLRQMMRIFIDNSVKYTPDGGHIWVSSVRRGETLEMSFADDGIGIAKENQEKVFQRFYRVESSRTKEKGGTGLGLPIARWIAERHGIKLTLESELGKGTKIILRIPLLN